MDTHKNAASHLDRSNSHPIDNCGHHHPLHPSSPHSHITSSPSEPANMSEPCPNSAPDGTNLHSLSKPEFLNISLAVSISLLQVSIGRTSHVQEILNIIRDPSFDAKLFSAHFHSLQDCHNIRNSIVRDTCNHN